MVCGPLCRTRTSRPVDASSSSLRGRYDVEGRYVRTVPPDWTEPPTSADLRDAFSSRAARFRRLWDRRSSSQTRLTRGSSQAAAPSSPSRAVAVSATVVWPRYHDDEGRWPWDVPLKPDG